VDSTEKHTGPAPAPSADASRRDFLQSAFAGAALLAMSGRVPSWVFGDDREAVLAQITAQHDATLATLREWIALPSIAAENRNYPEGAEYMARLARDAGFGRVDVIQTKGKPGVVARLDAGAATTLALYFMYSSTHPNGARRRSKDGLSIARSRIGSRGAAA
jgi:hypothetical protein